MIIDPHTAVGLSVGLPLKTEGIPIIFAETAQPAKFEDAIVRSIEIKPPVPKGYEDLLSRERRTYVTDADPQAVKNYIAQHVD